MSQQPEHYTPQYINNNNVNNSNGYSRNPFAPSYGFHREANTRNFERKSLIIAYILLFIIGFLGFHKLYLKQPFMFLFYVFLFGIGWLTHFILIGYIFWSVLGLLMFFDIFTMPIRVGLINMSARR